MATEIGTRIKRARERRRWTQRQLADALNVDRKTVDNWENGRTTPRSSIGAIEEILGVRLDAEPEPVPAMPEGLRRDIVNADGLTPGERQAIISAIEETLARERGGTASSVQAAEPEGDPERWRPASLSAVPSREGASPCRAQPPGSARHARLTSTGLI